MIRSSSSSPKTFLGLFASHHIYASAKKQGIVAEAEARGLTGVYVWGKPGRVVVEHECRDVVERYFRTVGSWRWQKIRSEVIEVDRAPTSNSNSKSSRCRYFSNFAELDSHAELQQLLESKKLNNAWKALNTPFKAPRVSHVNAMFVK